MLFSSWEDLLRTLVVGPLAYVALLFFIRISGKRSLSKLNAFDLVLTVALGSALATVLMAKDISLADGVLALGLLLGLQFVVTWSQVRFAFVRRLVKSEPTLMVYDGMILEGALKAERVVAAEIYQVMRLAGFGSVAEVHAVVLETDGTFSVMGSASEEGRSTMVTVPSVGKRGQADDLGTTREIASIDESGGSEADSAEENASGGQSRGGSGHPGSSSSGSKASQRTKGRG